MKHVLIISIGPVQDFISAARKTRDLWYGSKLLSDIAREAAVKLESAGAELIFPSRTDTASVPNKIVALVGDMLDPSTVAATAKRAAQDTWNGEALAALEVANTRGAAKSIYEDSFWSQIRSVLEFYAAWSPIEGDDYSGARQRAERLLAGRKAFRDFRQPEYAVGRPKSSLNGGREAVLPKNVDEMVLDRLQIKKGELLDGVSLVKRLAQRQQFPSISRVAADPWLRSLRGSAKLEQIAAVAGRWTGGDNPPVTRLGASETEFPQYSYFPYDTQLFYEVDHVAASDCPPAATKLQEVMGSKPPSPYVAILAADGDRMGRQISSLDTPDKHRQLSEALVVFAHKAEAVVRKHNGALIYAGGDDVMAFVPLDRAIPCAAALNDAFADAVRPVLTGASISIGVAIVHHLTQLDEALSWARNAERAAKQERGSLAVSLHTRSAGTECVTVSDLWNGENPLGLWNEAVRLLRSDDVPDGLAYKLRKLAVEFEPLSPAETGEALRAEVAQILRHSRRGGDLAIDATVQDSLKRVIGSDLSKLRIAVDRLIIARHLERVGLEATS